MDRGHEHVEVRLKSEPRTVKGVRKKRRRAAERARLGQPPRFTDRNRDPHWQVETLNEWRAYIFARDGACKNCGYIGDMLTAHHLIFRSHSEYRYKYDVRNGVALCNGFASGCHDAIHAGRLKIAPEWLTPETVECLAEQGLRWVDGEPVGTLARYFASVHPDQSGSILEGS